MKYRFLPAADRQQDEIWGYTFDTWGEKQADSYIKGLHAALNGAALGKNIWRKLDHPKLRNVYFIRYEHHFIFFRIFSNDILGVISILHENMDILTRLVDDEKY